MRKLIDNSLVEATEPPWFWAKGVMMAEQTESASSGTFSSNSRNACLPSDRSQLLRTGAVALIAGNRWFRLGFRRTTFGRSATAIGRRAAPLVNVKRRSGQTSNNRQTHGSVTNIGF